MKRLLMAAMVLMGVASAVVAATVPKYNAATVDVAKVTGNYNSWKWVWPGYSANYGYLYFTNGSSSVDLTGYTAAFKVVKKTSAGQTAYVSLSGTDITLSGATAVFTVPYTNIPSDGEYLSEFWIYETATPANARVLGQGKIVAIDSLYAEDDSTFPWPTNQAALVNYVPITRTVTINGEAGGLSSNISFTIAAGGTGDLTKAVADVTYAPISVVDTTFTNYLAGDTEIAVAGDARSGSNVLSIASTITRDTELAAYLQIAGGTMANGSTIYFTDANMGMLRSEMTPILSIYNSVFPSFTTTLSIGTNGVQVSDSTKRLIVDGSISEGGTLLSAKYFPLTGGSGYSVVNQATNNLALEFWTASNRWAYVERYGSITNVTFITPAR